MSISFKIGLAHKSRQTELFTRARVGRICKEIMLFSFNVWDYGELFALRLKIEMCDLARCSDGSVGWYEIYNLSSHSLAGERCRFSFTPSRASAARHGRENFIGLFSR